jgi:acyl carrier protein
MTDTSELPATGNHGHARILGEIIDILRPILDEYGIDIVIGAHTNFHDDLGLESIDLVLLTSCLHERYGEHVNLADYFSRLTLDQIIALTLGDIADFVLGQLATKEASTS